MISPVFDGNNNNFKTLFEDSSLQMQDIQINTNVDKPKEDLDIPVSPIHDENENNSPILQINESKSNKSVQSSKEKRLEELRQKHREQKERLDERKSKSR